MQSTFKARFWRYFRWGALVFCALFVFRLIYGYVATGTTGGSDFSSDYFDQISDLRKNYASEKVAQQPDFTTNSKYEKTAIVKTTSSDFTKEEKDIRGKVDNYKGVIQYEKALGKKGNRELHLMIGINPATFDSFYHEIQGIGVIRSMSITKIDKTNDYRQLNAKKISLEKTMTSLEALKKTGVSGSDLLTIYDRQLMLEQQLQDLGVDLGAFNTENEFCTVKLSLYEGATAKSISFIHRVKVALEWTLHFFAFAVMGAVGLVLCVFVLLLFIDKLNVLNLIK